MKTILILALFVLLIGSVFAEKVKFDVYVYAQPSDKALSGKLDPVPDIPVSQHYYDSNYGNGGDLTLKTVKTDSNGKATFEIDNKTSSWFQVDNSGIQYTYDNFDGTAKSKISHKFSLKSGKVCRDDFGVSKCGVSAKIIFFGEPSSTDFSVHVLTKDNYKNPVQGVLVTLYSKLTGKKIDEKTTNKYGSVTFPYTELPYQEEMVFMFKKEDKKYDSSIDGTEPAFYTKVVNTGSNKFKYCLQDSKGKKTCGVYNLHAYEEQTKNNLISLTVYAEDFNSYQQNSKSTPVSNAKITGYRKSDNKAILSGVTDSSGFVQLALTEDSVYFTAAKGSSTYNQSVTRTYFYDKNSDNPCEKDVSGSQTCLIGGEKVYLFLANLGKIKDTSKVNIPNKNAYQSTGKKTTADSKKSDSSVDKSTDSSSKTTAETKIQTTTVNNDKFTIHVLTADGKPVSNGYVAMYSPDKTIYIRGLYTDKSGNLIFESKHFKVGQQVYFALVVNGKKFNKDGNSVTFVNTGTDSEGYCEYLVGSKSQCKITEYTIVQSSESFSASDQNNEISEKIETLKSKVKSKLTVFSNTLFGTYNFEDQ